MRDIKKQMDFITRNESSIIAFLLGLLLVFVFIFSLLLYLLHCMPLPAHVSDFSRENVPVRHHIDGISTDSRNLEVVYNADHNSVQLTQTGHSHRYIIFRGWAFIPNEKILSATSYFVLQDTATGQYLRIPTTMELREELATNPEDDRADPSRNFSGMYGVVAKRFLKDGNTYHLYIAYTNNEHQYLVDTDQVLTLEKGTLYLQ